MTPPAFARLTVCLLIAWVCAAVPVRAEETAERKTNIVLLIGDDHGWPYYGFMGSETVSTPNLDYLARNGTVLTTAHTTSSVCRPALLTLLTGLYPVQYYDRLNAMSEEDLEFRSGTEFFSPDQRRMWSFAIQEFLTLPRLLSSAGYVSFEGGKYWEGTFDKAGFTDGMSKDWNDNVMEHYGLIHALAGGDGLVFGRETSQPMYDFIDKHADDPFFIWYAPMLPHTPLNPPRRFTRLYEGRGLSESAILYYANCTWYDAGVGELLDFLEDRDLLSNTLLVYVNDNGWQQDPHVDHTGREDLAGLGGPLGKNSLHDFGFRTPLVFFQPGVIPEGRRTDALASTVDLFPTLLDYAGLDIPEGLPGSSLRPLIEARTEAARSQLFGSMHQLRGPRGWTKQFETTGYYTRTPGWHFITCRARGITELHDLTMNPASSVNVASDHPDLVDRFEQDISRWLDETIPGDARAVGVPGRESVLNCPRCESTITGAAHKH